MIPFFTWFNRALAIGCIVMGAVLFRSCVTRGPRQEAAVARVEASLADARARSGQDAVAVVGSAAERETTVANITQDNANAIIAEPGSSVQIDPRLGAAGRRGLCRYAAYRDSEQCKRLFSVDSARVETAR